MLKYTNLRFNSSNENDLGSYISIFENLSELYNVNLEFDYYVNLSDEKEKKTDIS